MIRTLVGCAGLVALGLLYAAADAVIGVSALPGASSFVLGAGFLVVAAATAGRKLPVRRLLLAVALFAAFAAWVVTLRDSDAPLHRFRWVYWRIEPGMTRAEVEALFREAFPGRRPLSQWSPRGGFYRLGGLDPSADPEVIEIALKDGRVASTRYLPD